MTHCVPWRTTIAPVLVIAAALAGCRPVDRGVATEPPPDPIFPPPVSPEPHPGAVPRFVDVARASGIDFTPFNDADAGAWLMVEVLGSGAAWIDADLDGWLDLYLTDGCRSASWRVGDGEHRDRLYRGRGPDGFHDVSAAAGIGDDHYGQGVAVGDYDADGFPDLYLANFGPAVLLHNNGDGTFTDVTAGSGIDVIRWCTSAAFADLDHDGHLDVYACAYVDNTPDNNEPCINHLRRNYCGPAMTVGEQDVAWTGNGDGTFVESSQRLGFLEHGGRGKGLGMTVVDLDGDLRSEIYVGNDMQPNFLWVGRTTESGEIHYEDLAPTAGCAVADDGRSEASMGVICEDFDGDGLPDLYLTHFYLWKNTLYRNLGGLQFADASHETRIAQATFENLGFGAVALDWDRDGRMEMFNANGHVLGPNVIPYEMPPQLLWQAEDRTFIDVSEAVEDGYFRGAWVGRAAAGADYDNDGDIDIAITHTTTPTALLRDDTAAPGRFLGLDLRTPSRIPPIGGRVEVSCGGRRAVRPIASGGSYLSSHDPRLLFTLPAGDSPADVTIHWPSGRVDRVSLGADAYWQVLEGGAPNRIGPPATSSGRGQSLPGMR